MSIKDTALKFLSSHGKGGGLVVSALNSGASGPGSSAALGYCAVFLGKTHFTVTVPLSTQLYTNGYRQIVTK